MDLRWSRGFGLALLGRDVPEHAVEWARAAERAGFGSVWIAEDYYQPGAFTLAGAVAAATERITVGLGVVNPYTRHPAILAMETAALAGVAPGRIVLGLGTSNPNWIEAEQPGVRTATAIAERWWNAFQDPVLSRLVDAAYKQNLPLRAAGLRVIQAQARRAIAIGDLFPQEQALSGGYTRDERSTNAPFSPIGPRAL